MKFQEMNLNSRYREFKMKIHSKFLNDGIISISDDTINNRHTYGHNVFIMKIRVSGIFNESLGTYLHIDDFVHAISDEFDVKIGKSSIVCYNNTNEFEIAYLVTNKNK